MVECSCVICTGRLPSYFRRLHPDLQAMTLSSIREISGEQGLEAILLSERSGDAPAPLRSLAEQRMGSPDQSVALHERFDPVDHFFV